MHNLTRSVYPSRYHVWTFSFPWTSSPPFCAPMSVRYSNPQFLSLSGLSVPTSVAGAELYTMGLSAAECFVQHNTKPKRIWCYRSSCPHCEWGRENGYRGCKSVESLCHPQLLNQHSLLKCICPMPHGQREQFHNSPANHLFSAFLFRCCLSFKNKHIHGKSMCLVITSSHVLFSVWNFPF